MPGDYQYEIIPCHQAKSGDPAAHHISGKRCNTSTCRLQVRQARPDVVASRSELCVGRGTAPHALALVRDRRAPVRRPLEGPQPVAACVKARTNPSWPPLGLVWQAERVVTHPTGATAASRPTSTKSSRRSEAPAGTRLDDLSAAATVTASRVARSERSSFQMAGRRRGAAAVSVLLVAHERWLSSQHADAGRSGGPGPTA